jgi:hypothetical protein
VVDLGAEAGGIDLDRVVALREWLLLVRAATRCEHRENQSTSAQAHGHSVAHPATMRV